MRPAAATRPVTLRDDEAIAELRARLAALEAIVAGLLAAQPRDRHDAELRQVLAASTKSLRFKAADLLAHARVDEALRTALANATIGSTAEAGAWLRANRGPRDGVTIARLPRRYWQASAYTCNTSSVDRATVRS